MNSVNSVFCWFSKKAEESVGSFSATTLDGKNVRVTMWSSRKDFLNTDNIYLGEMDLNVFNYTTSNCAYSSDFNPTNLNKENNNCSKCRHPIKERALFYSTYVGCMC